jgi:hypothetical protein
MIGSILVLALISSFFIPETIKKYKNAVLNERSTIFLILILNDLTGMKYGIGIDKNIFFCIRNSWSAELEQFKK